MLRLAGGGLIAALLLALWIYCIFDVIAAEEVLVRNLPKFTWLIIVIILADIGALAWLALGRPAYAGWRPGDTESRGPRRVVGPEDMPGFQSGPPPDLDRESLRDREDQIRAREQELLRREEDLHRREDGPPETPPTP